MRIEKDIEDVYDSTSVPQYDWEMYQRGFLGILNNAYNQSCNNGCGVLGRMSDIESEFEAQHTNGSWQDFVRFYIREHNGHDRTARAINSMVDNITSRVESIGGTVNQDEAVYWSRKYIWSMLLNTYTGFCSERMVISTIGESLNLPYETTGDETRGIDGTIGSHTVQVKPESHLMFDINYTEADSVVSYSVNDGSFVFEFPDDVAQSIGNK